METLRLASGTSPMALAQAARAGGRLAGRPGSLAVAKVFVETPLDPEKQIERIARKILEREADAGVCPASRLGSSLPAGVIVAALFQDRDPRYRCVSPDHPSLEGLPRHSRVVTCDPVSRAQIRHRHSQLQVDLAAPSWEIFAGLRHRAWDAACLPPEIFDVGSLAGLLNEPVAVEEVIPVVGQGKVALLARADHARVREILTEINDEDLETTLGAERAFLAGVSKALLDAVATARAVRKGWWVELAGILVQRDGRWLAASEGRLPFDSRESVEEEARRLAETCRAQAEKRDRTGVTSPGGVLVR